MNAGITVMQSNQVIILCVNKRYHSRKYWNHSIFIEFTKTKWLSISFTRTHSGVFIWDSKKFLALRSLNDHKKFMKTSEEQFRFIFSYISKSWRVCLVNKLIGRKYWTNSKNSISLHQATNWKGRELSYKLTKYLKHKLKKIWKHRIKFDKHFIFMFRY